MPEPLDALPDLILLVEHATGNPWIDVGERALGSGDGYPQWQPDGVVYLQKEWQKAQPILARIHRLLDWQKEVPAGLTRKLTTVRDALLAAYHQTQETAETAVPPEATHDE